MWAFKNQAKIHIHGSSEANRQTEVINQKTVHGSEVVLPLELMVLTEWTSFYQTNNNDGLRTNLELSTERRKITVIWQEHYEKQTENHYNQHVKCRPFKVGEEVLKKAKQANKNRKGS